MKKLIIALVAVLTLVSMVSCSTTNHGVAMAQNKKVVGKNNIKRPDWVVQDQSTNSIHYASGYGTGVTFETAKMKAKLNADSELALWISTSVETVRDRYLEETQEDKNATYMDRFVVSSTEAGQAVLSGIKEVDYWEDGEGGVWVLVSVPVKNVKAQIKATIQKTCQDSSLFAEGSSVSADAVMEKLNKALDELFPED